MSNSSDEFTDKNGAKHSKQMIEIESSMTQKYEEQKFDIKKEKQQNKN